MLEPAVPHQICRAICQTSKLKRSIQDGQPVRPDIPVLGVDTDRMHLHGRFPTFLAACIEAREAAVATVSETFLVRKEDQWEVWIDLDEDEMEASLWRHADELDREEEKKRKWMAELDAQDHEEMPGKCSCGSYFCPACGG